MNLKETYFTYKNLTKIHDEPNLETLAKLRKQLYANAASVPNSRYGTNGYLGMVMTPEQFQARSQVRFERPGAVPEVDTSVPRNTEGTDHILQQRERNYQRATAYVKEFAQMETTLFNQIREAIEEQYLAAYLDETTGNFNCTIPELLTYLIDTYAYISEEELEVKRMEVTGMTYSAGQPIDLVFKKVTEYANLADMAQTTITEAQKIAMAKVVIVRTGAYEQQLTDWNRKSDDDKTWAKFVEFFRRVHREMKQARPTLKDITLEANVAQADHEIEEALRQIQNQTQEQLLKVTLEENKKQMDAMMKTFQEMLNTQQQKIGNEPKQDKKGGNKKTRKKPQKYCAKCHKAGYGFRMFLSHNEEDCKNDQEQDA